MTIYEFWLNDLFRFKLKFRWWYCPQLKLILQNCHVKQGNPNSSWSEGGDQVGRPHSSGRCKRYANNPVFKVIRTANYVKSLINLVRKRAGAEKMTDDRLVTGRGGQECARLPPKTEPTDERSAGKSHHLGLLIPNRELTAEPAVKT